MGTTTVESVTAHYRAQMAAARKRRVRDAWKGRWRLPARCAGCREPIELRLQPFRWVGPNGRAHRCRARRAA